MKKTADHSKSNIFQRKRRGFPLRSIGTHTDAVRILEKGVSERPDIQWQLVGGAPYGVHGEVMVDNAE